MTMRAKFAGPSFAGKQAQFSLDRMRTKGTSDEAHPKGLREATASTASSETFIALALEADPAKGSTLNRIIFRRHGDRTDIAGRLLRLHHLCCRRRSVYW
jgi:hypothetical protein